MLRNLTRAFAIGGFVLGEIYMLFIVFAPSASGEVVPIAHQLKRVMVLSLFCGPFGALIGTGLGLLASALFRRR
jgi:hypothetical protein